MELRERPRASTWSGPKMSSEKKEKAEDKPDWVEMLERKPMEGIDKQSDKLMKKLTDFENTMQAVIEGIKKNYK